MAQIGDREKAVERRELDCSMEPHGQELPLVIKEHSQHALQLITLTQGTGGYLFVHNILVVEQVAIVSIIPIHEPVI